MSGAMLAGRVAVVTGASSGIGRATARLLAFEGASVVVADLRRDPREGGAPTTVLIEESGGRASYVECDVTRAADRAAVVAAAQDLGGLDVLVNGAGLFGGQPFLEVTETDFDRVESVNTRAVFFMAQAAARVMVAQGRGSIVNLSSVAGVQGAGGFATYCTTKFAVRGLTYALAEELGPSGVRVNAVHPGFIATSMTSVDVPLLGTPEGDEFTQTIPLRRVGTPDDVARAILALASDLGDYVTGASLVVDGGRMRV
jgi:NAD(P)-dependent dehydrogenase (short-subunit alcohol dehydrogenase family)